MVSKAVKIGIAVTAGVVTLTIIIVISVLAAPAKSDTGSDLDTFKILHGGQKFPFLAH